MGFLTVILVVGFLNSSNALVTLTAVEFSPILILLLMGTSGTKESNSALNYLFRFGMFFGCLLFADVLMRVSINMDATFLVRSAMGLALVAFLSKLPVFGLHQWLPRAHVECTAMGSSILRRVFLKLRSGVLNYSLPIRLLPIRLSLRLLPTRVYIYLVVHTLLSAAMFWLYSKEYESLRTRLFVTFGVFSSVWTMFLWLRLPFFPVFITELGVVVTFF